MRGGQVPQRVAAPPERLCLRCKQRTVYGSARTCRFCVDSETKQRKDHLETGVGSTQAKHARDKKEKKEKDEHGQP
jgi:hypothetical protein